MRTKILFFIVNILVFQVVFSQSIFNIKGKVVSNTDIIVAYAGVVLLKDSIIIKHTITDAKGKFMISGIKKGKYILQVSSLGYKPFEKKIIIRNNIDTLNITITQEAETLNTVVIKSRKQPLKVINEGYEINATIINNNKKYNMLNILRFAPNITTINGLEISGSDNIKILINNKEVLVRKEKIKDFLNSLNPEMVKKIQVIDGAKANLEHNADAYINIILKNNSGLNGTLETESLYNNYYGIMDNADLYYKVSKFYGYLSAYHLDKISEFTKNINKEIENEYNYYENSTGNLKRKSRDITLLLQYEIDSTTNISMAYNYMNDKDKDYHIKKDIIIGNTAVSDSNIISNKYFSHLNYTHTFSLQYNKLLDTLGSKLKLAIETAYDNYDTPDSLFQHFSGNNLVNDSIKKQFYFNDNFLYGFNIDYTKVFLKDLMFSTGIRFSQVNENEKNNYEFYNISGNYTNFSNEFYFLQPVFSQYVSINKIFGKTALTAGITNEFSRNSFGNKSAYETKNDYQYYFLPILNLSRKISDKFTLKLKFSKNIQRPAFYLFNKNSDIISMQNKFIGNPNLKPVINYSLLSYILVNRKYAIGMRYNRLEQNILFNNHFDHEKGIFISTPVNSGYRNYYALIFQLPVNIGKVYSMKNTIYFAYSNYYSNLINTENLATFFGGVTSYNQFKIGKKYFFETDISYISNNAYTNTYSKGNFYIDFFGSINLSRKIRLFIGIDDIFNTDKTEENIYNENYISSEYTKFNTRTIYIKLRYYFEKGFSDFDVEEYTPILENELNRLGK